MLKTLAIAAVAVAGVAAAPAVAGSYDAFTSFNAVNGTGGFVYGSTDGTTFSLFDSNANCVLVNVTCLRSTAASLPSVFKATGAAASEGTVLLATDRLLVHPGEGADSVFVAFAVTRQGSYSYSAEFNQQDTGNANQDPHSVGVTEFYTPSGGATQYFTRLVVDGTNPDIFTGYSAGFHVGDVFGYIVDKDGVYFNDSTGVNFSVAAVPEAATWALMIAGFGMVGVAQRGRRRIAA